MNNQSFSIYMGDDDMVDFPALTRENHDWWFRQIRLILIDLDLEEHLRVGNSCDFKPDRWHEARSNVWLMLVTLAWHYAKSAPSSATQRLMDDLENDDQDDTARAFRRLRAHFTTEVGPRV